MKKVLFVIDERKMGGVSILLESILSKIDRTKMKIDILILHDNGEMLKNLDPEIGILYGTPYFESVDYSIGELVKKKNISLLWKKCRLVFDMKTGRIKKKIQKERKKCLKEHYDVEVAFKDGFTALFTAYGTSERKIHWLHYEYEKLNPNGKYPKLFNDAFTKIDKIVAVSNGVMNCFNKIYHLENKTMVIKNIVESDKIRKKGNAEISVEEQNDPSKINFVSVGRLHFQKGYEQLLRAMSRLNQENLLDNVTLKIYGDGPLKEYLCGLNKELGLEKNIMFMGQRMNPFPYVKDSDMFILSSIYEPFGLVIVEAMSLQIPVLATSNAATGELIQNDIDGKIVENSEMGLYLGLKDIIENPEQIDKMKKQLVDFEYPIAEIIKQVEEVLEG